ncbi:MAG: signal peptidase I [Treponema sp.]|nr:signal peptidase I [Treponema sp.]MBQ1591977.1 signal peptidase I [Treponema sp.]MBR4387052.1 signal peptidase I [Treponema sp.]
MENSSIAKDSGAKKGSVFKFILAGLVLGLILKFFVIDILHVSGASMEPTINSGDLVPVNKLCYGLVKPFGDSLLFKWGKVKQGDVIIYMYDNNLVVKRCAAAENTPLEYSSDSGYNLIVGDKQYPLSPAQFSVMQDIKAVPQGMVLAIGDNAEVSIDSRNYGFVSEENVLGRVFSK